jgi:photosystem II stability/assembly factor-like uncharacterized protein
MMIRLPKCTLVLILTLWAICNRAQAQLPHLPSEFSQSYKTVYFATPLLGYVGSETALTKTTDGGAHWTLVWKGDDRDAAVYFFLSGSTFWRRSRELMRTTDGGQTFTSISMDYKGQDGRRALVFLVSFINPQTGWTWTPEQSEIAFTHDGGVTWTGKHLRGEIGHVRDVWIFDAQRGIAGTEAGVIRTSDGGVHWSVIPGTQTGFPEGPPTGMPVLRKLYCADDQRCLGLASTQPIRLYLTRDGGSTWTLQSLPVDDVRDKFSDAQLRTPQLAVVMGEDTKEVPEEQRWITAPDGSRTHVDIPDPNPFLLRWDGSTWSRQDITVFPDPLFSSPHPFFLDAQNGWAVSLWNEIYHTTDGGVTWTAVPDYFQQIAALTPSPTPFVLPTPSP